LVIDTKYYARPLAGSRFDGERLLAPHLYQLLAYLRNQSATPGQQVEGMLLYPASAASGELQLDYQLEGFRVQVRTLDLAQPWPQIRQSLLALVAD
jgi:5-methylcytosine-specific restriction enzyme subunit McrC